MASFHEDFKRETRSAGPSDRSFGLVVGAACWVAALAPLRHGRPVREWCLWAGAALLLASAVRPALLKRPNRIWLAGGRLLGRVMNPILAALLFYLVFTPVGLVLRRARKDPLGLSFDRQAQSYWSCRAGSPPATGGDSGMANQF